MLRIGKSNKFGNSQNYNVYQDYVENVNLLDKLSRIGLITFPNEVLFIFNTHKLEDIGIM